MSCVRHRIAGSGYVKPENLELEVQNNCALAELMAAREEQDATLQSMWISDEVEAPKERKESQLPPPVATVPLSDTCIEVDGHFYKFPDVERAMELHKSLSALEEARAKEEAMWSAHWTQSQPLPAWEINTEIAEVSHISDPIIKTELSIIHEELPTIEVMELN